MAMPAGVPARAPTHTTKRRTTVIHARGLVQTFETRQGRTKTEVLAVDDVDIEATPRKWLAVLFIVLALATAAVGWSRWARAERAMRRNEQLPGSVMTAVLVGGVAVAGIILLFAIGLR